MENKTYDTFDEVRNRLDEIVDELNTENIVLDDALALYEEAVKLGLAACDLSEEGAEILLNEEDGSQNVDTNTSQSKVDVAEEAASETSLSGDQVESYEQR